MTLYSTYKVLILVKTIYWNILIYINCLYSNWNYYIIVATYKTTCTVEPFAV